MYSSKNRNSVIRRLEVSKLKLDNYNMSSMFDLVTKDFAFACSNAVVGFECERDKRKTDENGSFFTTFEIYCIKWCTRNPSSGMNIIQSVW